MDRREKRAAARAAAKVAAATGPRRIALQREAHKGLQDLYGQALAASNRYQLVLNATVAALGLDPTAGHSFDIEAGVITIAEPPKPPKGKRAT